MKVSFFRKFFSILLVVAAAFASQFSLAAPNSIYPAQPNPPRLVNDFASMMTPEQQQQLETLLLDFDKTTSSQIAVVTVKNLDGHEVADYTIGLFNEWKIGQKGKNNGVLILASLEDRKMWITTGQGMEGALTDGQAGTIVRHELTPEFKAGNFYEGFRKASIAIIAATKGEYTADDPKGGGDGQGTVGAIIIIVIIIVIVLSVIFGKGGGGGGGNYMSSGGSGFVTGAILGSLLGGGGRGGSSWGGGGSTGGGGFGGFGGGFSGGGGAGGSW